MINTRYVELDTVIESINRDNPFPIDIDPLDVVEWIGEAMELINVPIQYVNRITDGHDHDKLTLIDGKAELPCDLSDVVQVKDCSSGRPLRYSTDAFHVQNRACVDLTCVTDPQYKFNNNFITTNYTEGDLVISYLAYPTDKNGYPLVPDDQRYRQAMKAYVLERMGYKLFIQGKLDNQRFTLLQQERTFYMASARNKGLMPNRDKMESLKNLWVRLLPDHYAHSTGMSSLGQRERFKNHTGNRRR